MTSEIIATPPSGEIDEQDGRRGAIAAIARTIARDDFGTGPLASLRRAGPDHVMTQSSFYRLLVHIPEDLAKSVADLLRWASVVHVMALGAKPGSAPSRVPAGAAFAEAGLSEARFSRLLASRGEAFRAQMILVARYMRAKDAQFSCLDVGELLLVEDRNEVWNADRADILRFRLARDYYRILDRPEETRKPS